MRRFSCTVKLVLTLKDDSVDESDVEAAVESALKRLRPSEISFDEIEELDPPDDAELDEEGNEPLDLDEEGEEGEEDD